MVVQVVVHTCPAGKLLQVGGHGKAVGGNAGRVALEQAAGQKHTEGGVSQAQASQAHRAHDFHAHVMLLLGKEGAFSTHPGSVCMDNEVSCCCTLLPAAAELTVKIGEP